MTEWQCYCKGAVGLCPTAHGSSSLFIGEKLLFNCWALKFPALFLSSGYKIFPLDIICLLNFSAALNWRHTILCGSKLNKLWARYDTMGKMANAKRDSVDLPNSNSIWCHLQSQSMFQQQSYETQSCCSRANAQPSEEYIRVLQHLLLTFI